MLHHSFFCGMWREGKEGERPVVCANLMILKMTYETGCFAAGFYPLLVRAPRRAPQHKYCALPGSSTPRCARNLRAVSALLASVLGNFLARISFFGRLFWNWLTNHFPSSPHYLLQSGPSSQPYRASFARWIHRPTISLSPPPLFPLAARLQPAFGADTKG